MDKLETIYDVLNHFKNTKRRLTQGGDSDFITLDYKQLLALIELSKREQQELNKANEKLKKIEEYITHTNRIPQDKVVKEKILSIIKGDD